MKITLHRLDDAFHMQSTNEDGLTVESDGSPAIGGHNKAMRPMQMVLAALGSCSSIDVIHLRPQIPVILGEISGQQVII